MPDVAFEEPALRQVSDQLTELKLGNGTSILITANIASSLPTSVGAALQSAASKDQSNLAVYFLALFATTLGVVYVQVSRGGSRLADCTTCAGGKAQFVTALRQLCDN